MQVFAMAYVTGKSSFLSAGGEKNESLSIRSSSKFQRRLIGAQRKMGDCAFTDSDSIALIGSSRPQLPDRFGYKM
jgi:hypothetical protein